MNQNEVKKLLAVIAARYPNSKVWDQEPALTVHTWHMSLDDVPYPAVNRVLVDWFKTEKWAPDPSELRDGALSLLESCATADEREALEPGWMAWRASPNPTRTVTGEALPSPLRAIS